MTIFYLWMRCVMQTRGLRPGGLILLWFCCLFIPISTWPQTVLPQSRIVQPVNEGTRVTLRGNTHPLAQPQYDQGPAPPDLPMERILLVLKRSPAQESELQRLLDDQQDKNSPKYHQWLDPDTFGQQFGPSDQDIQTVTTWLMSHGFRIGRVARGRTVIEFSGTASQVQQAFLTEIHKYAVNGEEHWANASDPQIPEALAPVVAGVNSLHNFPKQPMHHVAGVFSGSPVAGQVQVVKSEFTFPYSSQCAVSGYCYFVGPYDFATIYNVTPLWVGTPAIDGTGQSIAIVAESNINIQDVRDFRNLFGLPANDPQIIVDGPDPGLVPGVETEAVLDVEWSGAVAKGATIKLVPSASTNSSVGIDLSALYVIENNLAPIVSESFGECELFLGTAGNSFESGIREQAAAQGITFINSSGDEGAARCDPRTSNSPTPASHGLAVSGLASTPYGVAVGGTDFANFGPNFNFGVPSPYWRLTNDLNHASALGYIPETTWNSTCTNNVFVILGYGSSAEASCNNSHATNWVQALGGGGMSNCLSSDLVRPSTCTGGYPKPSWQSAPGVPMDGARDIPDVSLFASSGFNDSVYVACESDQLPIPASCALNYPSGFIGVAGTSVAAPAFAGIMAMVNQYTESTGQGNANYVLYRLASLPSQTGLNCNSSASPAGGCIFNDITSGTIAVPCARNSPNCNFTNGSDTYGILSGYNAGIGYDLATGLGSLNAYNLVHDWSLAKFTPTATNLTLNGGSLVNITHGQSVGLNITVSPNAATGDVSLVGSPHGNDSVAMGGFTLQNGTASGSTTSLAGGTSYQVRAHYAGDGIYASSDSNSVTVTVAPEPSKTLISIPVFDPTTGKETGNTPASLVFGSPYIARVDIGNASATLTYPPLAVCSPPACPTGSVTITDSLNAGTPTPLNGSGVFPLNSEGYTNYNSIQLTGGTHQLSASYQGDSSYSQSSSTYSLLVTPAGTQGNTNIAGSSPNITGIPVNLISTFSSTLAFGLAPTGTITFYDGADAIPGTPFVTGIAGVSASLPAMFQGDMNASFTTSGIHQITARYSGDANYAGGTSNVANLSVVYPTSTTESLSATTVNFGESISISAKVRTTSKNPPMTGTFRLSGDAANTAPITPILSIDSSGNQVLAATTTITPQQNENVMVSYSGDLNYAVSFGDDVHITVTIPDFTVAPGAASVAVTAGQTGTTMVTVTPKSTASSTVALTCNARNIAGATCSFSPASPLSLSGGVPASTMLMIATLPPSSSTTTSSLVTRWPWSSPIPPAPLGALAALEGLALLFLAYASKRRRRVALTSGLFCAGCLLLGCGSTSGSSGGGGIVGKSTSLTLSTSGVKAPSGASVTLTAVVTSANTVSGTITFIDSVAGTLAVVAVTNGQAAAQISNLSVGTHTISASYSGDVTDYPSNSNGAINQVITGTAQVTISGTTSTLTNSASFNVTIQ
jgi:hypothetical protein